MNGQLKCQQCGGEAMTAKTIAPLPVACEVCLSAPCLTPGFCEGCRAMDAREGQEVATRPRPNRTPQSVIEAIIWSIRARGPQAVHEPTNIERLSRCDDAAVAEIDEVITRLGGSDAR